LAIKPGPDFVPTGGLAYIGVGVSMEYLVLRVLDIETDIPALEEGVLVVGSIVPSLIIAEGALDTVRGTHHYLAMIIWKTLARDPERKAKIQSQIDAMKMGRLN